METWSYPPKGTFLPRSLGKKLGQERPKLFKSFDTIIGMDERMKGNSISPFLTFIETGDNQEEFKGSSLVQRETVTGFPATNSKEIP